MGSRYLLIQEWTTEAAVRRVQRLSKPPTSARGRLLSFAIIGAVCTLLFAAIYTAGRSFTGPLESNVLAVSLTVVLNFFANRRFTFDAARGPIHVQAAQYALVYVVGLGASTGLLYLALEVWRQPSRPLETLLAVASGGLATVIRFVLLSAWVFKQGGRSDFAFFRGPVTP